MPRFTTMILSTALTFGVAAAALAQETIVLYEAGQRETFNLRRGYAVEPGEHGGRQATRLVWNPGVGTLNEAAFRNRPDLAAFDAGVQLQIDVHTDDFPGMSNAGVRVIDAMGEIHQYGKLKLPEGEGWKTWKVDLSPDRVTDRWGGGDEGKGKIDPPVKLLSLLFNAPKKPEERRSILIGEIRRNAVDPDAVEPHAVLGGLNLTLETSQPITVVFKGNEDQLRYRIRHAEQLGEVSFRLKLAVTDYDGNRSEWSSDAMTLAPGATTELPLRGAIPGLGWYRMEPTLELADGSARLHRPARHLAYIDPVGVRSLPPDDGFYFGLDARMRSDAVMALVSRIGVDMLRYGSWSGVNVGEGQWRWSIFDDDISRIRTLGMQVLYSVTFTPDYAARDEYRQRRDAGEKIGNKTVTLANTPPRADALREALQPIIERTQRQGLHVYDLWNEPDLSGFWQGTTDEYLEFMRISYETIKSVQPDAVVLSGGIATMTGHGGHGLNPDMIPRMIVEGQDHYDAISVHQHGHFRNFKEGIDGPLAEYRRQLRADKPLWFTETGFNGDPREMAQVLVQKFALARARGAKGFIWYALYPPGRGGGYSLIDRHGDPLPVIPAYNEMVRLMRGKKFIAQHDLGSGAWVLEFAGEDERLTIVWAEEAAAVGQTLVWSVPAGVEAHAIDVMGKVSPMTMERGLASLELSGEVRYVRIGHRDAAVAGALVSFEGNLVGEPGRKVTARAMLSNPTSDEVTFDLSWRMPDGATTQQRVAVAAQTRRYPVVHELTMPTAVAAGEAAPTLTLTYALESGAMSGRLAIPLQAARRIPATPIDQRESDFVLESPEHVFNPNQADPNRTALVWSGADDLSARVWLALDDAALTLRIDVRDDEHVQSRAAAEMWQSDSVQVAFQALGQSRMWHLGLAHGEAGPMIHAFGFGEGEVDAPARVDLQTLPTAGGMRYLARLPLASFGLTADQLRLGALGLGLMVNDDDRGEREGWIELYPGFGKKKDTQDLLLVQFE